MVGQSDQSSLSSNLVFVNKIFIYLKSQPYLPSAQNVWMVVVLLGKHKRYNALRKCCLSFPIIHIHMTI